MKKVNQDKEKNKTQVNRKYGTEMVEMLFRELTREDDMEISRLDGFDEGLEQGRAEAVIELAGKMKPSGEPIEKISQCTVLFAEEIDMLIPHPNHQKRSI